MIIICPSPSSYAPVPNTPFSYPTHYISSTLSEYRLIDSRVEDTIPMSTVTHLRRPLQPETATACVSWDFSYSIVVIRLILVLLIGIFIWLLLNEQDQAMALSSAANTFWLDIEFSLFCLWIHNHDKTIDNILQVVSGMFLMHLPPGGNRCLQFSFVFVLSNSLFFMLVLNGFFAITRALSYSSNLSTNTLGHFLLVYSSTKW